MKQGRINPDVKDELSTMTSSSKKTLRSSGKDLYHATNYILRTMPGIKRGRKCLILLLPLTKIIESSNHKRLEKTSKISHHHHAHFGGCQSRHRTEQQSQIVIHHAFRIVILS